MSFGVPFRSSILYENEEDKPENNENNEIIINEQIKKDENESKNDDETQDWNANGGKGAFSQ